MQRVVGATPLIVKAALNAPVMPTRSERLDAVRGAAMVWMTAFHLAFDLNHWGFWRADFYRDPVWTWQRVAIVSLFVWCVGWGQALAESSGRRPQRFWHRWAQVAGAALLVSAGSWWMFPQSFIYFGILHGVALITLCLWGLSAVPKRGNATMWGLGALALVLPQVAPWAHATWPALEWLNQPGWNALGFISRKPITEDYAPLLPWLGVALWGMASARWCMRHCPEVVMRPVGAPWRGLAVLGRWSLSYYLLHQPVLMGGLMALRAWL